MLNNKIVKYSIAVFLIFTSILSNTFALETKPEPEKYGKNLIDLKKYLEDNINGVEMTRDLIKNMSDSDETKPDFLTELADYPKDIEDVKYDIALEPERVAYIKKYNLPFYTHTLWLDSNKHKVTKEELKEDFDSAAYSFKGSNKLLTMDSLERLYSDILHHNLDNLFLPSCNLMDDSYISSVGLYNYKRKDAKKNASLKDVIIKIVEVWGINNDCMEKIFSYNDKVKYPELKNVPDYERRFLNFAFDNKLYKRVKPVNLNQTIKENDAFELFKKTFLK